MICPNCSSALSPSAALCECGWVINDAVQGAEVTDFDWEGPRQDEAQEKKSVGIVLALAAIIIGIIVPLISLPGPFDNVKTEEDIIRLLIINTVFAVVGIILATISVKQNKKGGGKGGIGNFARVVCILWILLGPEIFKFMHLYM